MKRINHAKRKMTAGQTVFGPFVEFGLPSVVEMIGLAGFDFCILDGEHGTLTLDTMEPLIPACDLHQLTPIVRVADKGRRTLLGAVEMGAGGVLLPQVVGPEDVEEVVQQTKYRPVGRRGLAFTTRTRGYCMPYEGDYFADVNEQTLVCIQVETAEAYERVEAICRVPGLDLVFIGPYDLSDALGHTGETGHPEVVAAIERIVDVTRKAGLFAGLYVPGDAALAATWAAKGVQLIAYNTDCDILAAGLQQTAGGIANLRR